MYSWGWFTGHSLGQIWLMQYPAGVALSNINLLDVIIELFNFFMLAHSTVLPTHHKVTFRNIYLQLIFTYFHSIQKLLQSLELHKYLHSSFFLTRFIIAFYFTKKIVIMKLFHCWRESQSGKLHIFVLFFIFRICKSSFDSCNFIFFIIGLL